MSTMSRCHGCKRKNSYFYRESILLPYFELILSQSTENPFPGKREQKAATVAVSDPKGDNETQLRTTSHRYVGLLRFNNAPRPANNPPSVETSYLNAWTWNSKEPRAV